MRFFRVFLLVCVLGAGLAVSPVTPADAAMSSQESTLAGEFLQQLNAERAARGIAPLIQDSSLSSGALSWADTIAGRQTLVHSGAPVAEIIGYGGRTGSISQAWMKSSSHRNLIVDPNLGYAGVGVACDSSGRLWAVVQFRRIDTRLGTQSSSSQSPVMTPSASGSTCGSVSSSTVNSIKRLYSAYFLRSADSTGLAYWKSESSAGVTIPEMSEMFAGSLEFKNRYGNLSNRDFVRMVYINVMGREPDSGGYSYWLGKLSGSMSRGGMMTYFSESPEYRSRTGLY